MILCRNSPHASDHGEVSAKPSDASALVVVQTSGGSIYAQYQRESPILSMPSANSLAHSSSVTMACVPPLPLVAAVCFCVLVVAFLYSNSTAAYLVHAMSLYPDYLARIANTIPLHFTFIACILHLLHTFYLYCMRSKCSVCTCRSRAVLDTGIPHVNLTQGSTTIGSFDIHFDGMC